ncbi:MAG: hypothetical protein PHR47_00255 [Candidatus Pacebacteria bacterium]|nr:hypothetical protein [Candidatus Paceibacterota bacterium]
MDGKKFFDSKVFIVFFVIGEIILLLLAFGIGIIIGSKKADFSCNMDKNYGRNFGGPNIPGDLDGTFGNSHGIFGQIIKIEDDSIIIKDSNSTEKVISVKEDVPVKKFRDTIKLSDLKIDDRIVIIGSPNDNGEIEAKLIRFMPAPPNGSDTPEINENNNENLK